MVLDTETRVAIERAERTLLYRDTGKRPGIYIDVETIKTLVAAAKRAPSPESAGEQSTMDGTAGKPQGGQNIAGERAPEPTAESRCADTDTVRPPAPSTPPAPDGDAGSLPRDLTDAARRIESDAKALAEKDATIAALREDAARLDWLDACNRKMNERYKTTYGWRFYGWRFDWNCNRVAVLADCHIPALSVRAAIDAARKGE